MTSADTASLAVALATGGVVLVTYAQVRLSRRALASSIRPFLVDPRPSSADDKPEHLLFGAPGRISVQVERGSLFYRGAGDAAFHLSVAFENIGAGLAAVVGASIEPTVPADIYTSRRFVPVGGVVRVNAAILTSLEGAERFRDQWWAMDGLTVAIRYTDADGKQALVSRALIRQYATQAPFVQEISVSREGEPRPLAVGRGSY